jgi:hypothetical protein
MNVMVVVTQIWAMNLQKIGKICCRNLQKAKSKKKVGRTLFEEGE